MGKKRHAKWLVSILMVAGLMFPISAMADEATSLGTGPETSAAESVAESQDTAMVSVSPSAGSVTQPQTVEPDVATETSGSTEQDSAAPVAADDVSATIATDELGESAEGSSVTAEEAAQMQEEDGGSSAALVRAPSRAEQNDVITSIEAQLQDGSGPVGDVGQWQVFRLNAEFALPDGQVHEGDTTAITLPDKLKFNQTAGFDIKDDDGNVVAHAIIDGSAKTITLTYTDYAETHSDVTGNFYFYVQIDRDEVDEEETIPLIFNVSGKVVYGGDIHFIGIPTPSSSALSKSGYQVGDDGRTIRFQLVVNTQKQAFQDVVLTDAIVNPGFTIIPGSLVIYKGSWQEVHGDWHLIPRVDVTDEYEVNYSGDMTSFTISLGDISEVDGFQVLYDSVAAYDLVDGEVIRNDATMEANDTIVKTVYATATYYEAGGSAEGYVYTIKIKKVGEDGSPLAGAQFDVIRVSNGATVGSITTDASGEGSLSGLLKDSYQLVETVAPKGYVRPAAPFDVSSGEFGPDKVATVTVENTLQTIDIPVTKTWVGPGTESVTVHLVVDGEEKAGVQLNADNGWQHVYTDLPVYDVSDGHEIVYEVTEDPLAGYATEITGSAAEGYLVTNTNTQTIDIPVTKTWVGPSAGPVTIRLFADGVETGIIKLGEDNGWTATFEGLLRYDASDGHEIIYTVEEDPVAGYTCTVSGDVSSGFVFVNTADTPPEPDGPYPPAAGKKPSKLDKGGFTKPVKSNGSGLAKTGDGTQAFAVSAALLAAAAVLIAAGIVRRKKADGSRRDG